MSSHEDEMKKVVELNAANFKKDRININTLKYFWQVSPLSTGKRSSIPKFLRNNKLFDNFSDYELKKLSHFMHQRIFADEEVIIEEGDSGFGFYVIFNGNVEIYSKRNRIVDGVTNVWQQFVINLSKHEYFGELSLLEKQNIRNATAVSKGSSILLGIYKPDIEELIERYPLIGAKFLQSISLSLAQRFKIVTVEIRALKEKIIELENKLESSEV